jgi:hypothetical protein
MSCASALGRDDGVEGAAADAVVRCLGAIFEVGEGSRGVDGSNWGRVFGGRGVESYAIDAIGSLGTGVKATDADYWDGSVVRGPRNCLREQHLDAIILSRKALHVLLAVIVEN